MYCVLSQCKRNFYLSNILFARTSSFTKEVSSLSQQQTNFFSSSTATFQQNFSEESNDIFPTLSDDLDALNSETNDQQQEQQLQPNQLNLSSSKQHDYEPLLKKSRSLKPSRITLRIKQTRSCKLLSKHLQTNFDKYLPHHIAMLATKSVESQSSDFYAKIMMHRLAIMCLQNESKFALEGEDLLAFVYALGVFDIKISFDKNIFLKERIAESCREMNLEQLCAMANAVSLLWSDFRLFGEISRSICQQWTQQKETADPHQIVQATQYFRKRGYRCSDLLYVIRNVWTQETYEKLPVDSLINIIKLLKSSKINDLYTLQKIKNAAQNKNESEFNADDAFFLAKTFQEANLDFEDFQVKLQNQLQSKSQKECQQLIFSIERGNYNPEFIEQKIKNINLLELNIFELSDLVRFVGGEAKINSPSFQEFYHQIQLLIKPNLSVLNKQQIIQMLNGFSQSGFLQSPFLLQCLNNLENYIQQMEIDDILLLGQICENAQIGFNTILNKFKSNNFNFSNYSSQQIINFLFLQIKNGEKDQELFDLWKYSNSEIDINNIQQIEQLLDVIFCEEFYDQDFVDKISDILSNQIQNQQFFPVSDILKIAEKFANARHFDRNLMIKISQQIQNQEFQDVNQLFQFSQIFSFFGIVENDVWKTIAEKSLLLIDKNTKNTLIIQLGYNFAQVGYWDPVWWSHVYNYTINNLNILILPPKIQQIIFNIQKLSKNQIQLELIEASQKDFLDQKNQQKYLQVLELKALLKKMGLNVLNNDVTDANVDAGILINDNQIAFNFFGEADYTANKPHKFVGDALFCVRVLQSQDWQVINIPQVEWRQLIMFQEKTAYLATKLTRALPGWRSHAQFRNQKGGDSKGNQSNQKMQKKVGLQQVKEKKYENFLEL